ncbi:MAG: hypothetical protein ACTHLE_08550 [Agriterribacter sp.]
MEATEDVLTEFENQPASQLISWKWQLIAISYSILVAVYALVVKYFEFRLVIRAGLSDMRKYIISSHLPGQCLTIVGLWAVFSFLISLMPMNNYTYGQKLKLVAIVLLAAILSVTAVIFTQSYFDVREIVRFSTR